MLNHLNLTEQLKSHSFNTAIDAYHLEINTYSYSVIKTKDYLIHLNMFLYTYFLIEHRRDLEPFSLDNKNKIRMEGSVSKLIYLGEKILKGYRMKFTEAMNQTDHDLIKIALDFINDNYTNKISLQVVADNLHISKNYLCHLFKAETGYRFCEYVNMQRVNRAKKMIMENKKNFEYISFDCGFSSQSHFSTTFKKIAGYTPNEFKKLYA